MKNNALISIKGISGIGDDKDTLELITKGSYGVRNGITYIRYKENEASGMLGITTTLKIDNNNMVNLIRTGTSRSQLIIEQGKRHICYYDIGVGGIYVGVSSHEVKNNLTKTGGDLEFKYSLDVNSVLQSENHIFINVKELEENDEQFN